ncbi:MAG: CocE/NonD family hydrolase [Actinomycetota bacterium]|nr:CocE/NonD family hydrolase [Actinomycetota bacterium]
MGSRGSSARRALAVGMTTALLGGLLNAVSLPAQAQQMLPCDFMSQGEYSGEYAKVSEKGPYEIAPQQIAELPSDLDGATIQMGIVRPKVPAGTRVPVIVAASPYYHPLQTMDLRACKPFLTENFVPHGYAVVFLAVRGTADSGGCMNLMGPEERADLDQAVTWLGTRAWSNGSVGMVGKSYDGATQWEAAASGNPHLKTIVPLSGVPDLFELMYGNGTVDWRSPGILNGIYYSESAAFYAPGRSPEHTVEVTACPEYAVGMGASAYSAATAELDPFGYYAARRYRDAVVKKYRGSIYLVQGLQDWNVNPGQQFPWIWELEERGVYVKYLLGQWGHSWPYDDGSRMDWGDVLLAWFDRWLKGDREAALGPRVEVEDAQGNWRSSSDWRAGRRLELFLDPDHSLARKASGKKTSERIFADPFHMQGGYTQDMPSEHQGCPSSMCALFETPRFDSDFRLAGLPHVSLSVRPQGPGGQVSVYIYAVGDGAERLGWGQLDLRFQNGSDEAQVVEPGKMIQIGFDVQPLDVVVPKGARLQVVVSGGTGWNRLPSVQNYPIDLLLGAGRSSIELTSPAVQRNDFFEPPSR